jgi:hypothetical protein
MKHTRVILGVSLVALIVAFVAYSQMKPSPQGVEVGVASSQPAKGKAGSPSGGTGAGRSPAVAVVTDVAKSEDVPITLRYVGWVQPIASVAILTQVDGVIRDRPLSRARR